MGLTVDDFVGNKAVGSVNTEETQAVDIVQTGENATPAAPVLTEAKEFNFLSYLKEKKGLELEKEEDFDNIITRHKEYDTISEKAKRLEELESKYNKQSEYLKLAKNPRSHFASDEDFIINQVKLKDPHINEAALRKVVNTQDLSSMDDLHISVLGNMIGKKGRDTADAEIAVKEDILGDLYEDLKDAPVSEWPRNKQIKLQDYAESKRQQLGTIKSSIEPAKEYDFEAELNAERTKQEATRKQNFDGWKPAIAKIKDEFKEIDINGVKIPVDEDFRKKVIENYETIISNVNTPYSEEQKQAVFNEIEMRYLLNNKDKWAKAYQEHVIAEHEENRLKGKTNPSADKSRESLESKQSKRSAASYLLDN